MQGNIKSRGERARTANRRAKTKRAAWKKIFVKGSYYEYNMLAAVVLLICFGLIMLYSTSAYICQTSKSYNYDDMYLLKKQALISLGGFGIAILISKLDYHVLFFVAEYIYAAALLLMALVRTPLGQEVNGAKRWLKIGPLQFQPAEVAKIGVIILMSCLIVRLGKIVLEKKGRRVMLAAGGVQFFAAYLLTQNLSTAIIIMGIAVGIYFLYHPKTKVFLCVAAVILALAGIVVFIISKTMTLDSSGGFRFDRVLVWLNPSAAASEEGYQVLQGLYAIGSGGFFGKGLGNSVQKLGPLPEAQNDMIFTVICEELGIFGVCIIFILFAYLLYRLVIIASNAPDLFGSLLVSGVFIHIALQVILNIAVSVNLIPNTGVTLPFFSYGGTSFLFLMAEIGMVLSVANQIKFQ